MVCVFCRCYMISKNDISIVASKLTIAINAYKVILFGSYAKEQAHDSSDVVLLIIADSDLPRHKRSRALYGLLNPYPFALDLLVYTPQEIRQAVTSPFSFVSEILNEGVIVYER